MTSWWGKLEKNILIEQMNWPVGLSRHSHVEFSCSLVAGLTRDRNWLELFSLNRLLFLSIYYYYLFFFIVNFCLDYENEKRKNYLHWHWIYILNHDWGSSQAMWHNLVLDLAVADGDNTKVLKTTLDFSRSRLYIQQHLFIRDNNQKILSKNLNIVNFK